MWNIKHLLISIFFVALALFCLRAIIMGILKTTYIFGFILFTVCAIAFLRNAREK